MGAPEIFLFVLGIVIGGFMAYPATSKISRYARARAKRPRVVTAAISIASLAAVLLALALVALLALSGSWAQAFFDGPLAAAFDHLGMFGIVLGLVASIALVIALSLVTATAVGAMIGLVFDRVA